MTKINIYMTQEEKIKLRTLAATQDWSMNELLRNLIDIALKVKNEHEGPESSFWEKFGH